MCSRRLFLASVLSESFLCVKNHDKMDMPLCFFIMVEWLINHFFSLFNNNFSSTMRKITFCHVDSDNSDILIEEGTPSFSQVG